MTRPSSWPPATLALAVLGSVLTGYALLGRGFAYVGVSPIYVGELALGSALIALLTPRGLTGLWAVVRESRAAASLILLMLWCGARTLPYVPSEGIDALRDGALWGYACFALFLAAVCVKSAPHFRRVVRFYRWFAYAFLFLMPFVAAIQILLPGYRPVFPEAPSAIPSCRPGDWLVHLGGIAGAFVTGFVPAHTVALVFLSLESSVAAATRAGMLALLTAATIAAWFRPNSRQLWGWIGITLTVGSLFLLVDPRLPVGRVDRNLSARQLAENGLSLFGSTEDVGLETTKEWRLTWWTTIVDYTFHGPYFWTGKGFGINLAEDDGFLVIQQLRSPHSGHMTFLARAGVPGFALWILVQLSWAVSLLRARRESLRRRAVVWPQLFGFLICYWAAFMVNAAFDVFLEGPMGGIWFWSLFGVGLAAPILYRESPDLFEVRPVAVTPAKPLFEA